MFVKYIVQSSPKKRFTACYQQLNKDLHVTLLGLQPIYHSQEMGSAHDQYRRNNLLVTVHPVGFSILSFIQSHPKYRVSEVALAASSYYDRKVI